MFRPTRILLAAGLKPIKFSTGITGLPPHPDPLPILRATYTSTLHLLSNLPPTSVYRQATEAITKHRLQLVEKAGEDVNAVEGELGMVEGILEEAKAEQALVGKMLEWKSWEGLEVESPQGQWTYFDPGSEGESTPSA